MEALEPWSRWWEVCFVEMSNPECGKVMKWSLQLKATVPVYGWLVSWTVGRVGYSKRTVRDLSWADNSNSQSRLRIRRWRRSRDVWFESHVELLNVDIEVGLHYLQVWWEIVDFMLLVPFSHMILTRSFSPVNCFIWSQRIYHSCASSPQHFSLLYNQFSKFTSPQSDPNPMHPHEPRL